jgi:hypothetical protein
MDQPHMRLYCERLKALAEWVESVEQSEADPYSPYAVIRTKRGGLYRAQIDADARRLSLLQYKTGKGEGHLPRRRDIDFNNPAIFEWGV